MTDWGSYYGSRFEEDEEQDQEGGGEAEGEFKYAGRDSIIFLIDASKAMFESTDEEELSPFDMTIACVRNVYTSKIISSDRDLLAVVFFGTGKHKNSVDFKHVYVLHDLDTPGAKRVLELDTFKGERGHECFRETIGHSLDFSLGEALWVCSNLFSDVKLKLSHKRIMLFTNEDDPHAGDNTKARMARTKADDLRDTGIILDLMNLKKPGGFDVSLFFRDIITLGSDEDIEFHTEASGKLDDLLRKVRAKEHKKRTLTRLKFKMGESVTFSVGVYTLVRSATKPFPVKLYRETNEQIKTKTRWFSPETGSLLLPSDMKKTQTYGSRQIVMENEEVEEVKRFEDPGFVLIGFKPLSMLKLHHHIRPAQFLYPEESIISGSTTLFSALLTKCLEKRVMAVCRYTARRNVAPRFVALLPQDEELDEQKVQIAPHGFHVIFLPYADDIRKLDYPEKVQANQDQIDKMKEIINKLKFKYRSESFENPSLQQHFRNLEALALDMMEPENVEDLTMPKVDMIDRRLGSIVEEFKELVYPPDYNPEGSAKRKQGGSDASAGKKPKMEVSLSKEDLRNYVNNGTLGKLTVPVLKDACKQFGLRGSKKQELLDALTDYFKKH